MRLERIQMSNKYNLMIGTPMYGGKADSIYIETILHIKHWCMKNDVNLEFCFVIDQSSISHARNDIAAEFLDSDCTHLLFLDADVGFNVDPSLKQMLEADLEFVVGSYPKKTIDWNRVVEMAKSGMSAEEISRKASTQLIAPNVPNFDYNQIVQVAQAPTGLMLLKREVFTHFRLSHGDQGRVYSSFGKPRYNYFGTGVLTAENIYLSEDIYFCRHYTAVGGKIYFMPWIEAVHEGHYRFKSEHK